MTRLSRLARLGQAVLRLVRHDAYRPEKHYMRGAGPKCRARPAAGTPPQGG